MKKTTSRSPLLTRRTLLGAGAGVGLAGVLGSTALTGCSSSSEEAAKANTSAALPDYIRYTGVKPDVPGSADGVPDLFLTYPTEPTAGTSGPPGDGSKIAASVLTFAPIPPTMNRNAYWQELNKRLGSTLSLSITPAGDYPDRFATSMAGDALGDLFTVAGGQAQTTQFLVSQCQELSEFLSGDAIAEYPFLANLATDSWRDGIFEGGIYGIPVPRGKIAAGVLYTRNDLFAQRGVDPAFKTVDELFALARKMNDPRNNKWAFAKAPLVIFQEMYGLPNQWRVEGGKFTNIIEIEGQKDALDAARRLIKEELVHPDSIDSEAPDVKGWFGQGSAAILYDAYTAMNGFYAQNVAGPSFEVGLQITPGPDGQPASMLIGPPNAAISAIRKTDPERVRMLLGVLNWLAAPFGTEEYLFRKYGAAGKHHKRQGADPVLTQTGTSETAGGAFAVAYLTDSPPQVYVPGQAEAAKRLHDHMKAAVPKASYNPAQFLTSQTQDRQGDALGKTLNDATNQILLGRQPVSSWDGIVKNWRSGGGDTIRAEYEKALAAQPS